MRAGSSGLTAVAFALAVALGPACNAIVGNGDIEIGSDGGSAGDATSRVDARVETGTPPRDAPGDATSEDAADVNETAPEVAVAADASCETGTKRCGDTCASLDDPAYGCGATGCGPCELANAVAGCEPVKGGTDGGAEGGALECSVAVCKGAHRDCDGLAADGCEVDTSDNLKNCGACGVDCSNLPHVAGNARCTAGACSFDQTACAPGYGICTTDPSKGCDTIISDPAHCGACTTPCSAGFPYCSPSGVTASPFTCTSGCAPGLSLCGGSCVDEKTDADHCGDCSTRCPAVVGGTPRCAAGPSCGFSCNAGNHVCGAGSAALCAANTDPDNCGTGAACHACQGPLNSTSTCTGGTTCGHVCNAGTHACGGACVLDSDPNNCGSLCGTNCPGPTTGAGSASCNGNACAITCTAGESLCGTVCVDEGTDPDHCGSCGVACSQAQTCSGGHCVCNAQSCPGGCCDVNQVCQPAACGSGGAACAVGCPAAIPEAANLVLWLVGDTYVSGAPTWADQSGRKADANCSTCPSTAPGPNGHVAVSFGGSSYFALSDPGGQYSAQAWTILLVAAPDAAAPSSAQLLAFSSGANDYLGLRRSGIDDDLVFQLLPGSDTNSILAVGAWASSWERITAAIDTTQSGSLDVGGSTATAKIGAPSAVDYLSSCVGTDPASHTQTYVGQVAEILVFNTTTLPSLSSLQTYLSNRYGLP